MDTFETFKVRRQLERELIREGKSSEPLPLFLSDRLLQCIDGPALLWAESLFKNMHNLCRINNMTLASITELIERLESEGFDKSHYIYTVLLQIRQYMLEEYRYYDTSTK